MENPTQEGASIHDRLMARLEPQEVEAEAETSEPEAIEDEESTQDIVEEEEIEVEASEEEEAEISEEDESPESQEQLSTEDLSSYLGLESDVFDIDDDGNVVIKTKVDGEEGKAKFQDVLASYQMRKHLDNESREVKQLQEQLNAKMAETESQVTERVQQLDAVIQTVLTEIESDENSAEMQELRESDPAEWTARLQESQARKARLAQAYQMAQQERSQLSQSQIAKLQAHLDSENDKLINAVDGWTDPDRASKEFGEVTSYLQSSYGFSDQDIRGRFENGVMVAPGISDHRLIVMAQKAMKFDQLQNNKPVVQKKVRKAPKLVKPGQAPTKPNKDKLLSQKRQAIKTGKSGSVAEYLLASGKV